MMRSIRILIIVLFTTVVSMNAQEIISGDYTELIIKEGSYKINKNVVVSEALIIKPGANVLLIDGASIICLGSVTINGNEKGIKIFSPKG